MEWLIIAKSKLHFMSEVCCWLTNKEKEDLNTCIDLDGHMRQLTEELHRVSNEMMRLREEMGQHWKLPKDKKVKENG